MNSLLRFFSLILLVYSNGLFSQNLTIASNGQTGTSGTNWSISNGTLTVAGGAATIQASVIENHLSNGNDLLVTVPGNLVVNQAITYSGTSPQSLTFNTKNQIIINQSVNATNAALSVVLATNYAYNTGGVDINANLSTNGGHLAIGGGYNSGTLAWNGLTIAGGNAASYTDGRDAVEISGAAINTGGGDVLIKANTNVSGNNASGHFYAVEIHDASINANGGDISITGYMRGDYQYGVGVMVGTSGSSTTIETSGTGTIDISGSAEDSANNYYGWRHGILIIAWSGIQPVAIRSEQGDISIAGTSSITNSNNYDNSGLQIQNGSSAGQIISIVSQSGAIGLTGTNTREASDEFSNGIRFSPNATANCIQIGQEGSTAYSGNISINANSLRVQNWASNSIDVETSGNFTLQPSGSSFTYYRVENQTADNFLLPTAWSLEVGGNLTIGKTGNTGNLDIGRPLAAGGNIALFGGDVDIHNNLNATGAGSEISVNAQLNIHTLTTANVSITTGSSSANGGDIKFLSDVDGNSTGNIFISLGLAMNSHGGNILFAGGDANGTGFASGYIHSPFESEGIRFEHTIEIDSEGGNITMRGRNTTNAVSTAYGNMGVGSWNNGYKSFDAGEGKIYIEGVARNGGGIDPGIGFYSGNSYVEFLSSNTSSDAIIFKGSSVADEGIIFDAPLGTKIYATGAGGGITMEAEGTLYAINFVRNTDVLAVSGPITLFSTNNKAYVNSGSSQVVLGSKAGTPITASSSDIELGFDTYNFSGIRQQVNCTGDFTIRPANGSTSFGQAVSNDWFTWSSTQFPSSLTMGAADNNTEISIDVAQTVEGPISLYGSLVDINASLTSSATGDILFKAVSSAIDALEIANGVNISKSSGTGTATLQSRSRINNAGAIQATGSGVLNIILWSDYNNGDLGGISGSGTLSSNGGHIWLGGSNSDGGTSTWNNLMVGNGPSVGAYGYNYNAMEFTGSITTNGGDVYIWAGNGYGSAADLFFQSGSSINSGSGDITIVTDQISNTSPCPITTTGHFTWEPNTTNGWATTYINQLDVDGNYSGANYTGVVDFDDFQFINFSSFGGFTLGNSTQTCGIRIYDALSINGPVEILGGYAVVASTIQAAGDVLIDADLGTQQSYDGFGIRIYNDITATSNGSITLLGRGGNSSTGAEHGIYLDPNTDLTVSGTGTITAVGQGGSSTGSECRGFVFGGSNTITSAGGAISITGYGGGSSSSNHNDGIQSADNGNNINAGSGAITLNGGINPFGANGESIALDYSLTLGGTGQSGDITLIGDVLYFNGTNTSSIETTGGVIIEPYSNSFEERLISWPLSGLFMSGNETGFTLGKTSNNWDLTVANDLNVNGDVNILGGNLTLNGNLSAGGSLNSHAKGNITIASSKTLTSTGGNLVLWSDYDNDGSGSISAGDNTTFTTSGGNIYLAGGTDTDSDGLPNGFATSSSTHGIELGTQASSTTTMTTSGGNILIQGKCTSTTATTGHGLSQNGLIDIDAGSGSITINGQSANWYGIDFASLVMSASTPWSIKSSATTGTAISISGTSSAASDYGVVFNFPVQKQIIADGGGTIEINGTGTGSNWGIFCQNTDFLSSSGTITLDGGVNGVKITDYGSRFGALAGSDVTSSTANVVLLGDQITVGDWRSGFSTKVLTSGTVSIQPYTTSSFGNGISWQAGTATSGWNLGKTSGSGSTTFDWETTTVN